MADKTKEKPAAEKKPTPEIKPKKHFFPKLSILLGLLIIVLVVLNYLNVWKIPQPLAVILLLLAGLVILWLGFAMGFEHKRKDVLKKYL